MGEIGQFLADWLSALWMVLAESGPFLLVGFVIAGVLAIVIPAQWIARRLGGDDVKSVATASIIGVPVPLCSCSVIPTATQLRRSGASKGATTAFLISTPETGIDSIGATWALMDPLMTVIRPLAAFVTAFAAGIAVNLFGKGSTGPLDQPETATALAPPAAFGEDDQGCCAHMATPEPEPAPEPEASCCAHETVAPISVSTADHDHAHDHAGETKGNLFQRAIRYAFGTLLDDLTPWFLIGFAISGLIVVAVPAGFFNGAGLSGWTGMLTMLIAGVPLYVCATASTPIAAAMMAKGLEPGAAIVFLLAGPATNVATMLVVKNLLGKRTLVLYLTSIAIMSLAIGALVNRLYPMFGLDPTAMDVDPAMMEHGVISTIAGITLGVLLLRSAWRLRLDRRFGAWLRKAGAPVGLDLTAWPMKVAAAALVLFGYASTAVTTAGPGETVFIEQFGRIAASRTTPGPLFHAPWPIATKRRVSTSEVHSLEFGVERLDLDDSSTDALALKEARAELKKVREEAEMLTGEGWIVSIAYAVQYRVSDGRSWLYGQSEPEELLRRLAQESIRQIAAKRTTEDILVGNSAGFRRATEERLARSMAAAEIGAELVGVELLSVHAPPAVHLAYRNVASALVERETTITEKEARAIEMVSLARTEATDTLQQAESAAAARRGLAEATATAFESLATVDSESEGAIQHLMMLDAEKRALTAPERSQASRYFAISPHIRIIRGAPTGDSRTGPGGDFGIDDPRDRTFRGDAR
ncbi:Modulator of FtsH protease HflK [Planctomycetes bacterium Poly30]|uniref:Modulator of FtsH protease HflK n=1 Tax=Saltatorellus ferox TaxID=2528018 RepID=A0A518ERG9_9BACT|nr:Modulator of FtsH protease HflK [Planctomycetes bacterium Poly30]